MATALDERARPDRSPTVIIFAAWMSGTQRHDPIATTVPVHPNR
jgi:hypothetical protein